jgi:hypothetical protein
MARIIHLVPLPEKRSQSSPRAGFEVRRDFPATPDFALYSSERQWFLP